MKEAKITELLKSGNFTLAYHDNGYCCLYKGKLAYDKLPEDGELASYDDNTEGYIPDEVSALVKALGGKVETI